MKPGILIIPLFIVSCALVPVSLGPKADSLKRLIMHCASDMERAKKVIIERDIIKNLTHLQSMDNGGKKYYLLEKEAITGMLHSVTKGAYADILLVNRDGRVVYTLNSDEIFSRSVRQLNGTPLAECFENRQTAVLYSSAGKLPADPGKQCIAFSSPVSGGATMPGMFIVIVDADRIRSLIGDEDVVLDSRGNYLLSPDTEKIRTRYEYFEKIKIPSDGGGIFTGPAGVRIAYRMVNYGALSWILVSVR